MWTLLHIHEHMHTHLQIQCHSAALWIQRWSCRHLHILLFLVLFLPDSCRGLPYCLYQFHPLEGDIHMHNTGNTSHDRSIFSFSCWMYMSLLPIVRMSPCLSLCLSNIISLRGVFSTYSSALCISPNELRLLSLISCAPPPGSSSSRNEAMPRKRGTTSRKI